jgi:hypothetical protein
VRWTLLSLDVLANAQGRTGAFTVAVRVHERGVVVSEGTIRVGSSCRTGRLLRWVADLAPPPGVSNASAVSGDFAITGTDPGLVGRCRPTAVEASFRRLLEAFDRGLGWTVAAAFQPGGRFDPYNGSAQSGHSYPAGIVPFIRARWKAGDGWTGLSLALPTTAGSDGVFSLRLRVTQHGRVISEGGTKIAVHCSDGKIVHWVGPLTGP